MNAWPTLREWFQFGGTLVLELVIVFAVAKLLMLRVRSAQGRRALWQITLLAMLLVGVGELNGVRGWLRLPEKKISPPAVTTKKVVVTFKDVEPGLEQFPDFAPAAIPPQPASRPSRWQERAVWPARLWAALAVLVLLRMFIAQGLALRLRLASHRSSGQPCPLSISDTEETADKAVRSSARAWRNSDAALRQRLGLLAQSLGLRRNVALLTSQRTVAPFTFGVWRPVIVLPRNFTTTFTPEQQDAALAHELAHVANFDSAWRTVSQFICAVLWWHPLVWLAKRELDHASELVADEASLLVANGPDRLAECLLACAKELRRPALAGWLGMDGGGFRSALGKRVTRLLQLNPHARLSRPVPWYLRLLAPVVCVALLWLGMAAVMKPGTPRGGAWRASILGSAFAAAAELKNKATAEVAVPVEEGKRPEVERGKTNLTSVLKSLGISTNKAYLYLDPETLTNGPMATGPQLKVGPRQATYDKLRNIRLSEWGPIDNRPLTEVIRDLSAAVRKADPERVGVNFIISPSAAGQEATVDSAGLPVTGTNEPVDVKAITIRLGTKLHNLSVEEVLNIVVKIADKKIKYSVEDWGVAISPKSNEATPLHTRFFHLEPNQLQQVLANTTAFSFSGNRNDGGRRGGGGGKEGSDTNGTNGISFLTDATASPAVISGVQNWFKSLGVDLTYPGKAVFFNDRLEMLMIRATLEDLDKIEKVFQMFGIKPGAKFLDGRAATGEPRNVSEQDQVEANKLFQDGILYYQTGRLEAARTNLQAALRLNPTIEEAHFYLAQLKKLEAAPNQVQEAGTTNLQTRFFKLDTNTLLQALQSVDATSFSPSGGRGGRGGGRGRGTASAPGNSSRTESQPNLSPTNLLLVLKGFFTAAGVDLDAPGKAVFYADRRGELMVRATTNDLDVIEKALQILQMSPSQLTIRIKVMEVPGSFAMDGSGVFGAWNQFSTNVPPREVFTNSGAPTVQGILTPEQYRYVIRAMEKSGGIDLMNRTGSGEMEVTTLSGRQAQIKVVDVQYIVTDLDYSAVKTNAALREKSPSVTNVTTGGGAGGGVGPLITPIAEPFELGPVVDLVPFVQADGKTIQMTVLPVLREFLGYDDSKPVVWATGGPYAQPPPVYEHVPRPKFRLRQSATTAAIYDGQTLVLGAGAARNVLRQRNNGITTTNYTDKALFYFITPRLIDPAGNPLHADEQLLEWHKTVPAQRNGGGKP